MEVILVEEVKNLGTVGDLVKVKPGFARNFLLPREMAIPASVQNKRRLDHEKRIASFRLKKFQESAKGLATKISNLQVEIQRKVGEQDKLFGSVTSRDIEEAMRAQGVDVDRKKIHLAEPIKAIGGYKVTIHLAEGVDATLNVFVAPEPDSEE